LKDMTLGMEDKVPVKSKLGGRHLKERRDIDLSNAPKQYCKKGNDEKWAQTKV